MGKKEEKSHVLLAQAKSCLETEDYQSAICMFLNVIEIIPKLAEARFGLGDSYFGIGEYIKAENAYRYGLEILPNCSDGLFGLAATLRVIESYEEAIGIYEQGFQIEPERFGAYWELAYCKELNDDVFGAEKAYRKCLEHYPEHGMAKHLLSAMLGNTTERAPDEYVRDLFDDYADSFEGDLVNDLNYVVPQLIKKELVLFSRKCSPWLNGQFSNALDLGCGTGLVSLAIRELVKTIAGVDLSEKMLALADSLQRYDTTYEQEMTAFLLDENMGSPKYDLIVCGDAMVYLGNLEILFLGVLKRLDPNGVFCFTLEDLRNGMFSIRRSGRYAHSQTYIKSLSKKFGFLILKTNPIVPRTDALKDIEGRIYLLAAPGHQLNKTG